MTYPTRQMLDALYHSLAMDGVLFPVTTIQKATPVLERAARAYEKAAWRHAENTPVDPPGLSETVLCHNATHKWVRFGRYYEQLGRWYYSGTNERSQYSETPDNGSKPTHYRPLPIGPEEPVSSASEVWKAARGVAPAATGDLSSEEFIRQQRDEWSERHET